MKDFGVLLVLLFSLGGSSQDSVVYTCGGPNTGMSVTFFDFIQSFQNFPLDIIVYARNVSLQITRGDNVTVIGVPFTWGTDTYQHKLVWLSNPSNASVNQETIQVKDLTSGSSCSYTVTFSSDPAPPRPTKLFYSGQLTKFNSYFAEVDASFEPGKVDISTTVTPNVDGQDKICDAANFQTFDLSDWDSFLNAGQIDTALRGQIWTYTTLPDCDGSNTLQISSVDLVISGGDLLFNKTEENDLICASNTPYTRILLNQEAQNFLDYIKGNICQHLPSSNCNLVGAPVLTNCGSVSTNVIVGVVVVILVLILIVGIFLGIRYYRRWKQSGGGTGTKFYRL